MRLSYLQGGLVVCPKTQPLMCIAVQMFRTPFWKGCRGKCPVAQPQMPQSLLHPASHSYGITVQSLWHTFGLSHDHHK